MNDFESFDIPIKPIIESTKIIHSLGFIDEKNFEKYINYLTPLIYESYSMKNLYKEVEEEEIESYPYRDREIRDFYNRVAAISITYFNKESYNYKDLFSVDYGIELQINFNSVRIYAIVVCNEKLRNISEINFVETLWLSSDFNEIKKYLSNYKYYIMNGILEKFIDIQKFIKKKLLELVEYYSKFSIMTSICDLNVITKIIEYEIKKYEINNNIYSFLHTIDNVISELNKNPSYYNKLFDGKPISLRDYVNIIRNSIDFEIFEIRAEHRDYCSVMVGEYRFSDSVEIYNEEKMKNVNYVFTVKYFIYLNLHYFDIDLLTSKIEYSFVIRGRRDYQRNFREKRFGKNITWKNKIEFEEHQSKDVNEILEKIIDDFNNKMGNLENSLRKFAKLYIDRITMEV